jgi:hypothetical protein
MAGHHALRREEVRALSLALQGDNFVPMLKGLHREGHPAIWYLLLRIGYAIAGSPVVLPAGSIGVASAAHSTHAPNCGAWFVSNNCRRER